MVSSITSSNCKYIFIITICWKSNKTHGTIISIGIIPYSKHYHASFSIPAGFYGIVYGLYYYGI